MVKRTRRRRRPGKKILAQSFIGQEGINLIEKRLLEMGFLWVQHGAMEAGIDGHLELRDFVSGEVLNSIILVQSRATREGFLAETNSSFEYLCDERDLNYWMMGNAPVILIRSRPRTGEAYWIAVKDYFKDPQRRARRRIRFDKSADRFDQSARRRLLALGLSRDQGIYLTPPPRHEKLYSNLLSVSRFGDTVYRATATTSDPGEIIAALREKEAYPPPEWRLNGTQFVSIHDLAKPPWDTVIAKGTQIPAPTTEWSQSDDPDQLRDFVFLLNRCLQNQLGARGVRFDRERCYYQPGREIRGDSPPILIE